MTPQEEAYEEALRRIREAERTGAVELDLSGWKEQEYTGLETLNRLPPGLERLTSLQSLDLSFCAQLSGDLSPLAGLTSLQSLNLFYCGQLSGDLSPLAGLTSLQSLNLSGCYQLSGDLSPLAGLTSLQSLNLSRCEQLSGDLSPLAGLTSLQSLNLFYCGQLSGDLSPLAGLTSLQSLTLHGCHELSGDLAPLAGLTSLQSLDLSGCGQLSGGLSTLARLTSLQSLDLSRCEQLSGDLSTLARLTSLQSLDLFGCPQLSGDLSPLASLTKLQSLNLSYCLGVRQFAPLESLLPTLKELYLLNCKLDDLPPEVCGKHWNENVLDKVRAHYEDLTFGQRIDAEVKVLFLGNGGVGKTQLCRRLRGETFDEKNVFSTHGIQLTDMPLSLAGFPEPVRLNLWDFGGQEIYYGSHSLFLQSQAVFLILWTPAHEAGTDSEGNLTFRRRPLAYWLDYLRTFAGTDASVLIVQSQCDSAHNRAKTRPPAKTDDFFLRWLEVSAKTGVGLNFVKGAIEEAVRDRFDRRPPPLIGVGRLRVRDQLRQMLEEDQKREPAKRQHRLLERAEFNRICDEAGGVSDKEALLDFLNHNGVIFYRSGLFDDRIVLDQNWALEAIYALFDRKKILPLFRGYGRLSRADLEARIWSDYSPEEQKVFLGMMESCGICFKVRELLEDEWEYIAPELLPERADVRVQEQLQGRLRDDPPNSELNARYSFLHEGILRSYLSKLGEHAKDAAVYWKYGCWFYEQTTRSQVLIESQWDDAASEAGAGAIRLRAWGQRANDLVEILRQALQNLPIGQAPEIRRFINSKVDISLHATTQARLIGSKQVDKLADLIFGKMKDFFVSYTKADQPWAEWIAWTLEGAGYSTVIQAWDFRPGTNFVLEMQQAATEANRTIAVLSKKYLESSFTASEWAAAFAQDPQGRKQKLIPIRIAPCELTGILAPINYLDLVGLPETDASAALLGAFSARNKPSSAPGFPGTTTPLTPSVTPSRPGYPGTSQTTAPPVAESLASLVENSAQNRGASRLSALERLEFMRKLNAILPQQFNMLVGAINPEPGLVPPMPAPQADRTTALVAWAEAPGGCGLTVIREVLKAVLDPQ